MAADTLTEDALMTCHFCGQPLGDVDVCEHHPDRENLPDHTVSCHTDCHNQHHRSNGDFARWGARSAGAGRLGYLAALAVAPDFHRLGGLTRTALNGRDRLGRFQRVVTPRH